MDQPVIKTNRRSGSVHDTPLKQVFVNPTLANEDLSITAAPRCPGYRSQYYTTLHSALLFGYASIIITCYGRHATANLFLDHPDIDPNCNCDANSM